MIFTNVIFVPVFLPGKFPWTEEPARLQSWHCKELDMTKQLTTHKINKSSLEVSIIFNHNFKCVKESKSIRTSVLQDRVLVLCSYVIKTVHY